MIIVNAARPQLVVRCLIYTMDDTDDMPDLLDRGGTAVGVPGGTVDDVLDDGDELEGLLEEELEKELEDELEKELERGLEEEEGGEAAQPAQAGTRRAADAAGPGAQQAVSLVHRRRRGCHAAPRSFASHAVALQARRPCQPALSCRAPQTAMSTRPAFRRTSGWRTMRENAARQLCMPLCRAARNLEPRLSCCRCRAAL